MKNYFELLMQGFATIGNTLLGTNEQIEEMFRAMFVLVVIVAGSLLVATIILVWASLLIHLIGR